MKREGTLIEYIIRIPVAAPNKTTDYCLATRAGYM